MMTVLTLEFYVLSIIKYVGCLMYLSLYYMCRDTTVQNLKKICT